MSESTETVQHTPGPWHVNEETVTKGHTVPHRQLRVLGDNQPHGAVLVCTFPETMTGQPPKTEANSRLIAASPDLLEACSTLLRWMREPWADDDSPANEAVIDRAEAAIALASPA